VGSGGLLGAEDSVTERITNFYVTVTENLIERGDPPVLTWVPWEVFLHPSEKDALARGLSEGIGKLLSTMLQAGLDLELAMKRLRGIHGAHPVFWAGHPKEIVRSEADAITKAWDIYKSIAGNGSLDARRSLFYEEGNG